jgi:hypothetical protein
MNCYNGVYLWYWRHIYLFVKSRIYNYLSRKPGHVTIFSSKCGLIFLAIRFRHLQRWDKNVAKHNCDLWQEISTQLWKLFTVHSNIIFVCLFVCLSVCKTSMDRYGPSKLAESIRFPTRFSPEPGSNFGHYADYSEGFLGYPRSLQVNARIIPLRSRHFP